MHLYGLGFRVSEKGILLNPDGTKAKTDVNKGGYLRKSFRLSKPAFNRRYSGSVGVHRIAAYQKFGDAVFEGGVVVRHLNNNKLDNSLKNIELGTKSENYNDSRDYLLDYAYKASKIHQEKVIDKNKDMWANIYLDREKGLTYNQLATKYGVSKSSLSYHLGNGKKHKSKIYEERILDSINI